jgi:hypothetical protein
MYNLMRPLDKAEIDYMQASVENIYDKFTSLVAEGRDMTVEDVDAIAQGRVWAGAEAIEIGLVDALKSGNYNFLDRMDPPEGVDMELAPYSADVFLSSCNAMTEDGILINIDGNANRVSAIAHGPKKIVFIVGMNKVCPDLDSAYKRVKMSAAPPNCNRLGKKTPCAVTGKCGDCLSPDCICTATVVTRRPNKPHRVKIILVGEALGY